MTVAVSLAVLAAALAGCPSPAPATPTAAAATEGLRVREPFDNVGYTHSAEGIEAVIAFAREKEAEAGVAGGTDSGASPPFAGVILPHDDYEYSAQVTVHALPGLRTHHVVLFGVAHHARDRPEVEGKLVFDSFDAWHGPYGDVPISPLREELRAALSAEDAVVNDELQAGEHSLESLVPFLQHEVRDVAIVPILVPYMSWERTVELSGRVSQALGESLQQHGWALGTDVAIAISSDAVHYGDRDWGGRAYADFGTDGAGYDRAVARDLELIESELVGPLEAGRLEALVRALVQEDFHEYRISWCGRFSIPLGLLVLRSTAEALGLPVPQGELLRYGTSLDPGRGDPGVPGLGITAPANLHHWVSFFALGYR